MMKHLFLSMILLFAVSSTIRAQLSLGVESGLNISTTKRFATTESFNDSYANTPYIAVELLPKYNYFISLVSKYKFNRSIALDMDLKYSREGYRTTEYNHINSAKHNYDYIRFIPKFEYRIFQFLGIHTGMDIGIKVREKIDIEYAYMEYCGTGIPFVGPMYRKDMDFGLVAGTKWYLGDTFLNISYTHGLIDASVYHNKTRKESNRNLQIGLGYVFKTKKKNIELIE